MALFSIVECTAAMRQNLPSSGSDKFSVRLMFSLSFVSQLGFCENHSTPPPKKIIHLHHSTWSGKKNTLMELHTFSPLLRKSSLSPSLQLFHFFFYLWEHELHWKSKSYSCQWTLVDADVIKPIFSNICSTLKESLCLWKKNNSEIVDIPFWSRQTVPTLKQLQHPAYQLFWTSWL